MKSRAGQATPLLACARRCRHDAVRARFLGEKLWPSSLRNCGDCMSFFIRAAWTLVFLVLLFSVAWSGLSLGPVVSSDDRFRFAFAELFALSTEGPPLFSISADAADEHTSLSNSLCALHPFAWTRGWSSMSVDESENACIVKGQLLGELQFRTKTKEPSQTAGRQCLPDLKWPRHACLAISEFACRVEATGSRLWVRPCRSHIRFL